MVSSLKKIKVKKLDHYTQQFHWPTPLFSHLITCAFATKIKSCKSSWKDGTWCPIAYEPPSKLQKQLHFHLFWNSIKNAWYKCVFHFHFHPNASISCIYNCKPFCSHLCKVISHFYQLPWRTIISKVTKLVDLDTSCKSMGWNGHDSL